MTKQHFGQGWLNLGLLASVFGIAVAGCVREESTESGSGATTGNGGAATTTPINTGRGGVTTTPSSTGKGGTPVTSGSGGTVFIPAQGGTPGAEPPPCVGLLETFQVTDPTQVCSASKVAASFTKINILIVLDKSGSMSTTPPSYSSTKWAGAVDALNKSLNPNDPLVSYGILLYPFAAPVEATTCELSSGAAAINVPVGPAPTTVPQINALMANTKPGGGTPTAAALGAALDYYTKGAGLGLEGSKYVLLVTDGGPNCNANVQCQVDTCTAFLDKSPSLSSCWNGAVANCCDASVGSIGGLDPQALCLDDMAVTSQLNSLRTANINTFVIGIPGSEAYASYLNSFADSGNVPVVPVPPKTARYYEVTGESGLAAAFTSITTSLVRSCTVPLVEAPKDLTKINVAVNCGALPVMTGTQVNWTYAATAAGPTITIEGPQCDVIKTVGVQRIDVVNGCLTLRVD